ncbi:D-glycero-beta-D-manno-heptose-7-phosphate kinase [bacterium]|nr:D-glycero-beta-D-manno-heptose-7-phosphate kinase [bacterium]
MISKERIKNLYRVMDGFSGKKILVLGDIIVDKFVFGKVSRISAEAPVPVVEIKEEKYMPGGAGNVVNNLWALGSEVLLCGVIGEDLVGKRLIEEFKNKGIETSGILVDSSRPTILKTRIIADHQQVVRTDKEVKNTLSEKMSKRVIEYINKVFSNIDAIIISDYGKGVINRKILGFIVNKAYKSGIPLLVDPKIEHFLLYKKVTGITPNHHEAGEAIHLKINDEKSLLMAGRKLMKRLNCQSLLITRGEEGMTLFEKKGRITHISTVAREVYDVTGAGDTVISVFALCLAVKKNSFLDAAYIANYAAGIVVGKLGTATVSIEEIKKAMKKVNRG